MFIATRIRIAQSPIGAECFVKKDVAPLELRYCFTSLFYKHIARIGLKLMRMEGDATLHGFTKRTTG